MHPIFGKTRQMTVADALRDISDDMLLTLVLAEVERRGLDPDAFGNRISRMGSEAARLMLRGSIT
jgi:hypothetical protein